jgi:uncharacterized surface protein with fasciclin (FAS1) repeats
MTGIRTLRIFTLAAAGLIALTAAGTTSAGSAPPAAPAARPQTANIVGTAAAAGQFKTLIMLAKRAGLVGALTGPGPLTVFAPTDAAFAKVPAKTLQALLANRAKLRRVLLYHVVAGEVKAEQVVGLKSARTLAKQPVRIAVRDGAVYLNRSAKVVKTDIGASNGVIHVINAVLIPPAK